MSTAEECVCCTSAEFVIPNIDDLQCITNHPQFSVIVLNSDVLTVAYIQIMMHKGQRGRAPDVLTNEQSRLTAYGQFVCWMLRGERLGKGKRLVIPSCVVQRIRKTFPDPNGQYRGFKTASESAVSVLW